MGLRGKKKTKREKEGQRKGKKHKEPGRKCLTFNKLP